jgi:hypothetical protein
LEDGSGDERGEAKRILVRSMNLRLNMVGLGFPCKRLKISPDHMRRRSFFHRIEIFLKGRVGHVSALPTDIAYTWSAQGKSGAQAAKPNSKRQQ